MDNKNVFIAIALSMAVLLFWGAYFQPQEQVDKSSKQQLLNNNEKKTSTGITPNINQPIEINLVTREQSINSVKRIKIIIYKNEICLRETLFTRSFKNPLYYIIVSF